MVVVGEVVTGMVVVEVVVVVGEMWEWMHMRSWLT